jgi:hypothetical protein
MADEVAAPQMRDPSSKMAKKTRKVNLVLNLA